MSDRAKDYQDGRSAGLELALRIVKEDGIKGLEDEIRFRGKANVNLGVEKKVLDKATEPLKELCCQTIRIAFISVLHDEFGFGKKRLRRAVNAFDKLTAYLMHGWLHWLDLVEEITNRMEMEVETSQITEANLGISYAHPNLEDVYEEQDLVDLDAWKAIMGRLGFTEQEDPDNKGSYILYDDAGTPAFEYAGSYERIGMYDFLCGVEYERTKNKTAEKNLSA